MRLSLRERRTRSLVQGRVQEIRGISLVFRERWDTTTLNLKPSNTVALPFVIPSAAEGSAVSRTFHGNVCRQSVPGKLAHPRSYM
jgi:hypothetical protein